MKPFPLNLPQTSPIEAISPRVVEKIEVNAAIRRDLRTALCQAGWLKNLRYWSTQIFDGGNSMISAEPNDMGISNNTGVIRKNIAEPTTIHSGQPICNGS